MGLVRILSIALACLGLIAAAPQSSVEDKATLDAILADPLAYQGRRVQVSGFLYAEFESPGLWASEEDFRNDAWHRTAILHHLRTTPRSVEDYEHPLNGRRVVVTGLVTVPDWDRTTVEISDVSAITIDSSDLNTERRWRVHPTIPMWLMLGSLTLVGSISCWGNSARRMFVRSP